MSDNNGYDSARVCLPAHVELIQDVVASRRSRRAGEGVLGSEGYCRRHADVVARRTVVGSGPGMPTSLKVTTEGRHSTSGNTSVGSQRHALSPASSACVQCASAPRPLSRRYTMPLVFPVPCVHADAAPLSRGQRTGETPHIIDRLYRHRPIKKGAPALGLLPVTAQTIGSWRSIHPPGEPSYPLRG